jgi:hypothetical protein
MLVSFVDKLSGLFDRRFMVAYWAPVFLATSVALAFAALHLGLANAFGWWLRLTVTQQIALGLMILLVITVLSYLLQALTTPIMQLYEGYWTGSASILADWSRLSQRRVWRKLQRTVDAHPRTRERLNKEVETTKKKRSQANIQLRKALVNLKKIELAQSVSDTASTPVDRTTAPGGAVATKTASEQKKYQATLKRYNAAVDQLDFPLSAHKLRQVRKLADQLQKLLPTGPTHTQQGLAETLQVQREKLETLQKHREELAEAELAYDSVLERLRKSTIEKEIAYHTRYYAFPKEQERLRPTRLGNVLTAAESYSHEKYRMDAVIWWPRLALLLPAVFRTQIDGEITVLIALVNLSALFTTIAFGMGISLAMVSTHWGLFTLAFVGGLVMARLCYLAAVKQAVSYGKLLRVAFDLHRHEVLKQMQLSVPDNLTDEQLYWQMLHSWIYEGRRPFDQRGWEKGRLERKPDLKTLYYAQDPASAPAQPQEVKLTVRFDQVNPDDSPG